MVHLLLEMVIVCSPFGYQCIIDICNCIRLKTTIGENLYFGLCIQCTRTLTLVSYYGNITR